VTGPPWLSAGLAALMILLAAFSAGRLVMSRLRRRGTELDADGVHVLMGVAMAGMLEPQLSLLPGAFWRAVFGAGAAWFCWQWVRVGRRRGQARPRCAHPAPHAVECLAMIYMLLPGGRPAGQGSAAMPGMTAAVGATGSNPALALILALCLLGYILWATDQFAGRSKSRIDPAAAATPGSSAAAAGSLIGPALAPRLAAAAKIAMSFAMGYMLVTMF
jgi:Domain of unknown function (DUF5134)